MNCPLCSREMIKGNSIDKHHLIPKAAGGKNIPPELCHKICHQKIHSLFTEKELLLYNSWDKLKEHQDIKKFIKWVQKKTVSKNITF